MSDLPYSDEAERAILAAAMQDNSLIPLLEPLRSQDFFLQAHREILRAIMELHRKGSPVDYLIVYQHLSDAGLLNAIGDGAYITEICRDLPPLGPDPAKARKHVQHYISILRDKAQQRQALYAANDVVESGGDPEQIKKLRKALSGKTNGKHRDVNKEKVDGWKEFFEKPDGSPPGVYARDYDSNNLPKELWICGPLEVAAITCDENRENWGRLLKWKDRDGNEHSWAMPMEMLAGSGERCRQALLNSGCEMSTVKAARDKVLKYIQQADSERRAISVSRLGWHGDVFVFPDEAIGDTKQEYFFQPPSEAHHNIRVQGTVADWREHVGKYGSGNSRLILGAAAAFAAPLIVPTDSESGGFHLYGHTTKGKSTVAIVAGSVWGGGGTRGYLETWRNTTNGLEIVGEIHNDGLGCLDEIGEVDPRLLGETVYMLANGQGKGRMTKSIGARRRLAWNMLFLSTGELTLQEHMESVGRIVKTGLEIRLVNIHYDAGRNMGIFEDIHGFADSKAFAEHLTAAAFRYYGAPIRAFVKHIAGNPLKIAGDVRQRIDSFTRDAVPVDAPSEVRRGARRFALCVAAAELATEIGLTGWDIQEIAPLIRKCLDEWRKSRNPSEDEAGVRQVQRFIEMHGQSRFQNFKQEQVVFNRAGYKRVIQSLDGEDLTEYLFTTEVFRSEVCKGFDSLSVLKALKERGFLTPGEQGHFSKRERTNEGSPRFYVVKSTILS